MLNIIYYKNNNNNYNNYNDYYFVYFYKNMRFITIYQLPYFTVTNMLC